MFDRLEIKVLPPGPRYVAQLRFWVNGEDVVAGAVGEGGRGPYADVVLPVGERGPLEGSGEPRRVDVGEPDCTGGCCGYLSVVVQRFGDVVQWSDWQVPKGEGAPPEFHFEAGAYDAELARVGADRWWSVPGWAARPVRRIGRRQSLFSGRPPGDVTPAPASAAPPTRSPRVPPAP